jgi:hypothetical protein
MEVGFPLCAISAFSVLFERENREEFGLEGT